MLTFHMSFTGDDAHRRLFEEIYRNYRRQMFLMARSVLSNDTYAEDIVHDVFLRIVKKHMPIISRIQSDIDLRNYLLKATKNAALDHLRKHRHERISVDADCEKNLTDAVEMSDNEFVDKICNNIEYDRIVTAISSLKDIYREALYYHFVLEMSVPEVAKLLNCKVATIKQRLIRGKKLLNEKLFLEGSKNGRQ